MVTTMNLEIQRHRVLVVWIMLVWGRVESIRFDLESGHTKCIAEDIKTNAMTVGKYQIINPIDDQPLPDTHKITVRVTSAYGNSYHYTDNVSGGNFAFQAIEAGDYMACFSAADHKPLTTMTVDFDWKSGVAAKDWTTLARKGSVESMELELRKMFDTVKAIHDEMFYLREREVEMQLLNASTSSKMAWFTFLSLFISISVVGVQVVHLKSFFHKKKLI